jgi:MarR family 2-MHQ and catechol resistance regulon transcriptional repressor
MVPVDPKLGVELIRLTRRCRGIDKHVSANAGLSIDEVHCLSVLFVESPSSVRTLSDLINVTPTRASKILRELEERGLLSRTIDVSDRRKENVILTEEGKKAVEQLLSLYNEIAAKVLPKWSNEVALDFSQLFQTVSNSDQNDPTQWD